MVKLNSVENKPQSFSGLQALWTDEVFDEFSQCFTDGLASACRYWLLARFYMDQRKPPPSAPDLIAVVPYRFIHVKLCTFDALPCASLLFAAC